MGPIVAKRRSHEVCQSSGAAAVVSEEGEEFWFRQFVEPDRSFRRCTLGENWCQPLPLFGRETTLRLHRQIDHVEGWHAEPRVPCLCGIRRVHEMMQEPAPSRWVHE